MNFIDYVTLYEEIIPFEIYETVVDDAIFNKQERGGPISPNKPEYDIKFNNPDYTRHVVSYRCNNIFFMDEKNIPLPISNDDNIGYNLKPCTDKKGVWDKEKGAGVYVIERYIINYTSGLNIESLLDTYKELRSINNESLENIRTDILKTTPNKAVFRIITYIPNSVLLKDKYVYSRSYNLCFTVGLPTIEALHPRSMSRLSKEKIKDVCYMDHTNLISIDIVNNNNASKPYYINIANKVHKIYSHRSNTKKDGCSIIMKKNTDIIEHNEYKLNELEINGIYDNEEKALHITDLDGILKIKKLENENKKLNITDKKNIIEENKVSLSFVNMEHEKFMMLLDKEMKTSTFKANKYKMRMDMKNDKINYDRDRIIFEEKLIMEQMKTVQTSMSFITSLAKIFF